MSLKHVLGSCHCGAVRYEADVDLSKGTIRCNCSICTKARAWFTFAGGEQFHLLAGESGSSYQWTPPGRPSPGLIYRFCKTCGVRIYATGDAEFMGGKFYALAVPRSTTSQPMSWPPPRSGSSTTGAIGSIAHQRTLGSCEPDNLEQVPSAHARHSPFITDPACPRHPLRSPRSIPV